MKLHCTEVRFASLHFGGFTTRGRSMTTLTRRGGKVRSCYRVSIPSNPAAQYFFKEVKTITKSPGNGIAESVKSCNLHQEGRILWF